MKQLRNENSRLKQLVAELSLDKTMLQDVLRRSGEAVTASATGPIPLRPVPTQRTACLWSATNQPRHLSLRESP
jgi:putative transposase